MITRRSTITGAAALLVTAGTAHAGLDTDNSVTALRTLIARYEALCKIADGAWEKADIIEACEAMNSAPRVRVQVGKLLHMTRDENGNDNFDPIYAYSDLEIERKIKPHMDGRLAMCWGPKKIEQAAAIRAGYAARIQTKKDELAALQAENDRIEIECGYRAAVDEASDASDACRAALQEIVGFLPSSLATAATLAAWIVWAASNDGVLQVGQDEVSTALASIAKAGAVS
jgi:hypothetical protein